MPILNTFAGSGGGVRIPLESPTMLVATPFDGSVQLTWQDPVDKVANPGGEEVATWNYTIVVRKVGSYPQTPGDGVEIVREKTRNQYQSTPYTDSLFIENGITYYYSVFAVSTIGVWSEPATDDAMPRNATVTYDKIIDTIDFGTANGYYGERDKVVTAAAYTTNHALFAGEYYDLGGTGVTYGYWTITYAAYSVDSSGVMSSVSNASVGPGAAGGSWKGKAFFGGGKYGRSYNTFGASSTVSVYSPELTRSGSSLNSSAYCGAFAGVGDYMVYAGGFDSDGDGLDTAFAFSDTLTKTTLDPLQSRNSGTGFLGGASVGTNYAVFTGGQASYISGYNNPYTTVYDTGLTRITTASNKGGYSCSMGCATLNERAIFGGGTGSQDGNGSSAVVTFDGYLTMQNLTGLSAARGTDRNGTAAVQFDGYVLFLAGNSTTTTGNLYNSAFTRTLLPNVTESSFRSGGLGAPAGNRGVFLKSGYGEYYNGYRGSIGPAMTFILA